MQAANPSVHVCSISPETIEHFPAQAPSPLQQLTAPPLAVPQRGHSVSFISSIFGSLGALSIVSTNAEIRAVVGCVVYATAPPARASSAAHRAMVERGSRPFHFSPGA
eukprot:scaffold2979_cov53-Phaeocystis_antarctica.AAC.3